MTATALAAVALAAIGAAVMLLGAIGVLVLRVSLAKVHAAALLSAVAPLFLGAALLLHEGWSSGAAKGGFAAVLLLIGSGALTYASANAVQRWHSRSGE
jgi:hypothetical protein